MIKKDSNGCKKRDQSQKHSLLAKNQKCDLAVEIKSK